MLADRSSIFRQFATPILLFSKTPFAVSLSECFYRDFYEHFVIGLSLRSALILRRETICAIQHTPKFRVRRSPKASDSRYIDYERRRLEKLYSIPSRAHQNRRTAPERSVHHRKLQSAPLSSQTAASKSQITCSQSFQVINWPKTVGPAFSRSRFKSASKARLLAKKVAGDKKSHFDLILSRVCNSIANRLQSIKLQHSNFN